MKRPVIYVLEAGSISGGVRVVYEHLNRLHARGRHVEVYSLDASRPTWFKLNPAIPWVKFDNYDHLARHLAGRNAIKTATWWKTAGVVAAASKPDEGHYFIQDIEAHYYSAPIQKRMVMETYDLPLVQFTDSIYASDALGCPFIGLGIDTDVYKPLDLRRQLNSVLALSRPQVLKGWSTLCELYRILFHSHQFTLLSFGTAGVHPPYAGVVPKGIPDEELVKVYNRTGIYVSTSLHEGFCAKPDTLVWANGSLSRIDAVKVGDEVFTHTGHSKVVTRVMSRPYRGPLVSIRCVGGQDISLTPEHPVLSGKKIHGNNYSNPTWINASDLTTDHCVYLPLIKSRNIPVSLSVAELANTVQRDGRLYVGARNQYGVMHRHWASRSYDDHISSTDDLMYLMGAYVGDGCVSGSRIIFSLSEQKRRNGTVERVRNAIHNVLGTEPVIKDMDRNRVSVAVGDRVFAELFIRSCGGHAKEKILPGWVFDLPESQRVALLRGLWDTDGTICPNADRIRMRYSTTSFPLAMQIRMLVLQFGIRVSVVRLKNRVEFGVELGGSASYDLAAVLGYHTGDKPQLKASGQSWVRDGLLGLQVREVSALEYDGEVYNLEVDGDNSYSTESFIVHNCLPALEAMACGTVVVTTNADGNMVYSRNEENCLLVPPGDAVALADACFALLEDTSLMVKLQQGGFETVKEWPWDKAIDKLEAIYG